MWLSPDNFQYVLDGGHRISVLLGWITDDWGDRLSEDDYKDATVQENIRQAANRVRALLRQKKIGSYKEYIEAEEQYIDLKDKGQIPEQVMSFTNLTYANAVRRWESINIGFPILWVTGNYEKAEESFLKINKTGRSLSDWETKLVENRSSSFARAVMSIAQIGDVEHCWPIHDAEVAGDPALKEKAEQIIKKVKEIHELLFEPAYKRPVTEQKQPLMATPYTKPEKKAGYLAELLTITEGKKGQKPETEALIKKDRSDRVSHIVTNGLRLVEDATDVIGNIYGPSPRSLALMPLVYFYNKQGDYIRSLLYGMVYWINHGSERDIQDRKLVFTLHRQAFEEVIIGSKEHIINRIGRRIGSGPEVTYPTARYYHGLLNLLIEHGSQIDSQEFQAAHNHLITTLGKTDFDGDEDVSTSRTFRGSMRAEVHVNDLLTMFKKCDICGGRYFPGLFTQVDHKKEHRKGGKTTVSNARNTHPFCNNNRETLEELGKKASMVELPAFGDPEKLPKQEQLKFLFMTNDPEGEDDDPEEVIIEEENPESNGT